MPAGTPQAACRILLVEDEYLITMLVEDMLGELGYAVAATADRLEDALALARTGAFDAALLDVRLGDRASYPVAEALTARGIPFAFVTGGDGSGLDAAYGAAPVLRKPFRRRDLAETIARLLPSAVGHRPTTPPTDAD